MAAAWVAMSSRYLTVWRSSTDASSLAKCTKPPAGKIALNRATSLRATQGPRLESAAEVNRLERDGADMVGMTGMPEAALAKELGLCYAAIAVVANYAAGRGTSVHAIRLGEAHAVLEKAMGGVRNILERVVEGDSDGD